MQRTRIKICGIKDVDIAMTAVNAGADAIGLVFVEQSPRHVDTETAYKITAALPAFVEPVGLFVNVDPYEASGIGEETEINTVQLHGDENIEAIRTHWMGRFRIIKAVPYEFNRVHELRQSPVLSAVLIDAPPKNGLTGGTGQIIDWQKLGRIDPTGGRPVILAGGLTPANVGEAIRTVRPYAVDVSSGVESSRGVKDPGLIRAFCEAVRAADDALNREDET